MPVEPPPDDEPAVNQRIPYRRQSGLRATRGEDPQSGAVQYFLRSSSGELFILSEPDYFIWFALDGRTSLAELESGFGSQFGIGIDTQYLSGFIEGLLQAGLIEPCFGEPPAEDRPITEPDPLPLPNRQTEPSAAQTAGGFPRPSPPRAPIEDAFSFVLCSSNRPFMVLAAALRPFRRLCWLLIPFTFLSCLIVLKHANQYSADWNSLITKLSWWPVLITAETLLGFLTRIVQGTVVAGLGGTVRQFRVWLMLGVFPRFYLDETSLQSVPPRRQFWVHACTLATRMALFGIGTWVWLLYRSTQPTISSVGLYCSFLGAITFIGCACPLLPQDGYRLLTVYTGQQDLLMRAWRLLTLRLKGRRAPVTMTTAQRWSVVLLAAGVVITMTLFIGYLLIELNVEAIRNLGGFGAGLLIGAYVVIGMYVYAVRRVLYQRLDLQAQFRQGQRRRTASDPIGPSL